MKIKKPTGISDPGYFLLLAVNFSAYKVVYYSLVFVCIVSLVNKPLSLSFHDVYKTRIYFTELNYMYPLPFIVTT